MFTNKRAVKTKIVLSTNHQFPILTPSFGIQRQFTSSQSCLFYSQTYADRHLGVLWIQAVNYALLKPKKGRSSKYGATFTLCLPLYHKQAFLIVNNSAITQNLG